ncbi:MAG: response regulator transcription factor [SAR202 cluster bacterium]|jgi:DNA-binding response OmpR family regulator|nr:response regulator transcription factor [SAR202 cluster bacterium]MDP6511649.1 response regulator transcription factor [SAR202 cluster bacterium]
MPNKVLVVEDEANLLVALEYNLKSEGYNVFTAEDGETGLALARQEKPDLVILDVMLPNLDGFEVCRILRRESDVRILMLTARGEEIDRVVGLELGADDYVTKPFSNRELMARVRNMIRRSDSDDGASASTDAETLASGDLIVDLTGHTVKLQDKPLDVKPREFSLLALLVANKGRAFTRDQILERLWGHDYIGDTRTVDVHIRWLREKIEPDPASPQRITTIRGVGYRFDG